MKTIYFYIKDHLKNDYNPFVYAFTTVFLFISFFINYHYDFEDVILAKSINTIQGYFYFIAFFAFAYFPVLIIKIIKSKKQTVFLSTELWVKTIIFISLIGLAGAFYYYKPILSHFNQSNEIFYMKKILDNSKRILIYIIPLLVLKFWFDKNEKGLYGLHFSKINIKPYLLMLVIVAPFIYLASFQSDFLHTYPKIKPWGLQDTFGLKPISLTAIFEFIYGFDFVFVELIFRGALVIGMIKLLGKDAVLPMVCAYAFLHFGKPVGEAISSVFGGYILGVIALYSRNIIGGCVIHIGIALTMEACAMFQYYF